MSNPYNFTNQEMMFYAAQCIANGNWHLFKEDRNLVLQKLKMFCGYINLNAFNLNKFIVDSYQQVQNSMMSTREQSFEIIQFQPPFKDFGKQNLKDLLTGWVEKGEGGLEMKFAEIFSYGWETRKPPREIVKVICGDSTTEEMAVRFSGRSIERRVSAEQWFINYNFGKEGAVWKREKNFTGQSANGEKKLSIWNIRLSDGTRKTLFFDNYALHS